MREQAIPTTVWLLGMCVRNCLWYRAEVEAARVMAADAEAEPEPASSGHA